MTQFQKTVYGDNIIIIIIIIIIIKNLYIQTSESLQWLLVWLYPLFSETDGCNIIKALVYYYYHYYY